MKHCQAGVGQLCDQVLGESRGEFGIGDELSAPPVMAWADNSLKSNLMLLGWQKKRKRYENQIKIASHR